MGKALTLHQPWASLIALGVKTIETRSWATKYRGPLVIHAGAKRPRRIWSQYERPDLYDDCRIDRYLDIQEDGNNPGQFAYDWAGPLGTVIATCTLVDVLPIGRCHDPYHEAVPSRAVGVAWDESKAWHIVGDTAADVTDQLPYGDFSPNRYAWMLSNVKPLDEPVPAKGHQGLWEWAP